MELFDYYLCKKVCRLYKDKSNEILWKVNSVDDVASGVLYAARSLDLDLKKITSLINRLTKKETSIKSSVKTDSKYIITDTDDKSFAIPIKIDNVDKSVYIQRFMVYERLPTDMFIYSREFNNLKGYHILNIMSSPFVKNKHEFCSISDADKPLGSLGRLDPKVIKKDEINILYLCSLSISHLYQKINECLNSTHTVMILIMTDEDLRQLPFLTLHKRGTFDVKDIARNEFHLKNLYLFTNKPDQVIKKIETLFLPQ
jgi:hypothetical protein